MPNWLEKFKKYLLIAVIVAIPSNLFFKLGLESAYLNGLLVDYLIPKIYLLDCFLLLFFIVELVSYLINKKRKKIKLKFKKIDLVILSLLLVFLLRNLEQILVIYRLLSAFLFLIILKKDKSLKEEIPKAVLISLTVQSFFAYFQFKKQDSLAPYYFFGESDLHHFAGISHGSFVDQEKILPYGTTAHPNILAGLVLIFTIFITQLGPLKKDQRILLFFNCLIIILLTQSLAALATLLLFFAYLISSEDRKNKFNWQKNILFIIALLFFILSPQLLEALNWDILSMQRRITLNKAAAKIFTARPIFGVGFNQFTKYLESFSQNREVVKFIQPVHHFGLLILSEGGLLLASIFTLIGLKYREKINWQKLSTLAPIAALDHYLITQSSGLFALVLFLYFTSENSRN